MALDPLMVGVRKCVFGGSADHVRPQVNLRIRVRGYPLSVSAVPASPHTFVMYPQPADELQV